MAEITIGGREYTKLAVAGTKERITEMCREYLFGTEVELTDNGHFRRVKDGKELSLQAVTKGKRIYLVY